jgi:ketosteroid isomerase-like protein
MEMHAKEESPMAIQTVMSSERTQAILTLYLQDLLRGGRFARFFADDVVVSVMWSDLVARGRDAAEKLIVTMRREAFAAAPVIKNLLVGVGKAMLEADFVATHIAEFAGRAATGKDVNVPYCAIYDLKDEKITQLRLYFPMDELLRQLDA